MSREKTCCFTGHRILGEDLDLKKLVATIIDLHKNKGVDTFISGGAIGFDMKAAAAVLCVKSQFGLDVKLHIYAPCNNQSERWTIGEKGIYRSILAGADYVDMVDRPYFDGCMKDRNYKMVDASKYCIAYYHEKSSFRSGTGQTVRYARKQGLTVINLAECE